MAYEGKKVFFFALTSVSAFSQVWTDISPVWSVQLIEQNFPQSKDCKNGKVGDFSKHVLNNLLMKFMILFQLYYKGNNLLMIVFPEMYKQREPVVYSNHSKH